MFLKKWYVFLICITLFFQCINNVQEPDTAIYLEFESIWQYLKIYSIYQDECSSGSGPDCKKRLDNNPYSYKSPSAMLDSMYDTLKGYRFTQYEDPFDMNQFDESSPDSFYNSAESSDSTDSSDNVDSFSQVSFDSLTPITAKIALHSFERGSTYREFFEVIQSLKSEYKNIIIDLRYNGGGDLSVLDSILEMFLPAGKEYILARNREFDSLSRTFKTLDFHPLKTRRSTNTVLAGKKFVVLVNSNTASASEILVAALKDCAQAVIAGENTFGKAIGQIHIRRRGRRNVMITFTQYKGISFGMYQNIGIRPDVLIDEQNEKNYLHKALSIVEPGISINGFNYPEESYLSKKASWGPCGYLSIDEK